jgi:hypothetical protein
MSGSLGGTRVERVAGAVLAAAVVAYVLVTVAELAGVEVASVLSEVVEALFWLSMAAWLAFANTLAVGRRWTLVGAAGFAVGGVTGLAGVVVQATVLETLSFLGLAVAAVVLLVGLFLGRRPRTA